MSGLSRSNHSYSKPRRSLRRNNTISGKSSQQDRLSRSNSLGRNSLMRLESESHLSFRTNDAFGEDIFNIDPSMEMSHSDSFNASFDDIPPFEESESATETVDPFLEIQQRRKSLKKSRSLSRRDLMAKSSSLRSLRKSSSQRRLKSTSLRNVTTVMEF